MDKESENLSIGTKNGCLTIIDDFSAYQREIANEKIKKLEKEKQDFINGIKSDTSNVDSVEYYDRWINDYKSSKYYKCKCKCGKILFLDERRFLMKRHRYCSNECGIKQKQKERLLETYQRIKDESYDYKLLNTFFESLEIKECINDNYERLSGYYDKRKRGGGIFKIYKIYKCRCYLCGKEYEILSSKFKIRNDTYGPKATDGYYSEAFCNCHKISSFQWRTIDIFRKYNVDYRVEFSFKDLYGIGNKNLLRYDFAIYDENKNIKALIECQGEQHYKPVKEFGGDYQYNIQKENDKLKREYALNNKIPLIEIPFKCNTYELEENFLKKEKII